MVSNLLWTVKNTDHWKAQSRDSSRFQFGLGLQLMATITDLLSCIGYCRLTDAWLLLIWHGCMADDHILTIGDTARLELLWNMGCTAWISLSWRERKSAQVHVNSILSMFYTQSRELTLCNKFSIWRVKFGALSTTRRVNVCTRLAFNINPHFEGFLWFLWSCSG